ncbi:DUF3726 domain-containing protein [Roseovarius salis]|uniref:DUF3726 domain-containing protein n=1 Tax=Roseovarius salis TaxID=3376063 RepID=UPI0037C6FA49
MTWSLNEIENLARKAARGAGMDWGPAEEAGRATRWLCAAGWPGAEALAELLARNDGAPWDSLRPRTGQDPWQATGGTLCPVAAGTAICDWAHEWAGGGTARLGRTAQPILLIPFMAMAADLAGARLGIGWQGVTVTRGDGLTRVDITDMAALRKSSVDAVHVGPATHTRGERVTRAYRATVPAETARALAQLAHRTYAPATPESRLSGAGAGLSDND